VPGSTPAARPATATTIVAMRDRLLVWVAAAACGGSEEGRERLDRSRLVSEICMESPPLQLVIRLH
jgi:hypothetical protein